MFHVTLRILHVKYREWICRHKGFLFFLFFKVFLGGHMSFFGATGTPVLDFWWCLLWGSKPEWVLPYSLFVEANVMYIPQDPLLVLHLPTSWQPAHSRSLPNMHVLRWDLARIRTGKGFLSIHVKAPLHGVYWASVELIGEMYLIQKQESVKWKVSMETR